MKNKKLIEQVRQAVYEVEPKAKIILYGSRSRESARKESDWDFLIVVEGSLDDERIDRIRHSLYEVEWKSGEVISSIIRTSDQWNSNLYKTLPFYKNIEQEGIVL